MQEAQLQTIALGNKFMTFGSQSLCKLLSRSVLVFRFIACLLAVFPVELLIFHVEL